MAVVKSSLSAVKLDDKGFLIFSSVLAVAICAADQVIRITPTSPAVGFSEESNVNFTCRSLKNVTWTLPKSNFEFDPALLNVTCYHAIYLIN